MDGLTEKSTRRTNEEGPGRHSERLGEVDDYSTLPQYRQLERGRLSQEDAMGVG